MQDLRVLSIVDFILWNWLFASRYSSTLNYTEEQRFIRFERGGCDQEAAAHREKFDYAFRKEIREKKFPLLM
ncbi:hypothetical protein X975_26440, partial [Stegodyphus mimosarum]